MVKGLPADVFILMFGTLKYSLISLHSKSQNNKMSQLKFRRDIFLQPDLSSSDTMGVKTGNSCCAAEIIWDLSDCSTVFLDPFRYLLLMSLCVCRHSYSTIDVQKLTRQMSPNGCDYKFVQRFYLNNIVVKSHYATVHGLSCLAPL